MMRNVSMRAFLVCALSGVVLLASGCSWLRGKSDYERAVEGRSLEIPPDLDSPRVDPAMAIPATASAAQTDAARGPGGVRIVASGAFPVADSVESTWRRLGLALERVEGVEIVDRAQVLSAYSVRYEGQEFLVRVSRDGERSRVGAVDGEGREVTGGVAGKLLATLRERLG